MQFKHAFYCVVGFTGATPDSNGTVDDMAFLKKLFGSKREPITKSPDQQLISKIGLNGSATAVTSFSYRHKK